MKKYDGFMQVRTDEHDVAIDIPSMHAMTKDAYLAYAKDHLLFMDHHEILRSNLGQYPIATTAAQVDLLISVLGDYRARMPS